MQGSGSLTICIELKTTENGWKKVCCSQILYSNVSSSLWFGSTSFPTPLDNDLDTEFSHGILPGH